MHAPEFWHQQDGWSRLAVAALAPLGWAYSASVAWKAHHAAPYRPKAAVICVGNLTVGGTGKTPIAIAIARALMVRGRRPFFLSRGYGGKLHGPILVVPEHRAADVGDEPLLLAAAAPVVVSRNRGEGAALAEAHGADVIVMDDGHQNFTLAKDLSLIVVDAQQQFGNGFVLPAGPLREFVGQGLSRADGVVVVGDGDPPLAGYRGPVLRARMTHVDVPDLKGRRVVGFAGIGRPEKFFKSLRAFGAEIVATKRFADHHVYKLSEIARLKAKARTANALLITTEKDYVRLPDVEREGIAVLPVRAAIDNMDALDRLLDTLCAPR
ncbi:MAG: tetraacyldisaccharide 4'-kinase [Alphaproteobacteria bacterium]|nr:tetraacyldisaccharide 4'-kinase [Alphaproteobacteria bacterium]MDE2111201.1 tetraacyldisaccharide 4'-kinase [Alphaproteobacteria bacterium]